MHAPVGGKRELIAALDARGARYGIADYALSYPITFLTNERIVMASSTSSRCSSTSERWRRIMRRRLESCDGRAAQIRQC